MIKRRQVRISIAESKTKSRLWAFGYCDLAYILKLSKDRVKRLVLSRAFNPEDLLSVIEYYNKRNKPKNGD